ncbi:MAG: sigma-70 family RNA polymerase sigma factor, partial [Bdellovibrionales bacterium]|nr:sigma-70 family RNA polymerase sigma factor [Bdellovibrionales bacterium]
GRLKNRAQADDLFQATFLKLHSHRQKYDSSLPFLPWLFAISQSVLMDFFRKAGRDQNLVQALEEVVPDMSVEETGSGVSIHLEGLPEREKTALTLRYENECSFEEIAERLHTTSPNVRKIVSRAIKTLRTGGGSHGK